MAYLDDLDAILDELSRTSGQPEPGGFIERNRAIDRLELHLDELTHRMGGDSQRSLDLTGRVLAFRDRLQGLNDSMAQTLRGRIAAGNVSSGELMTIFRQYVDGGRRDARDHVQYDDLDALIAGVLLTEQAVDDRALELHPEMVGYQPTPARLVLEMIDELGPTERDVFVDLGSGLGTVATLVALLTGARAIGIEWSPSYCAHARACAAALNLASVSFVEQDARAADLSTGTIFYMFTPFKGAMLREVLRRLDDEGRSRAIRLCVHGPLLRETIPEFSSFALDKARRQGDFVTVFRSSPVG